MGQRQLLNQILKTFSPNVYFQPPASVQMVYPAIVYNRGRAETIFADNSPYRLTKNYEIILISRNPDETLWNALAAMPMCRHERFYVVDNLNHDVFSLYF